MTEKQSPTMMMTPDQLRGLIDAQPIGYVTANGMRMLIQDEATVMLYRHDYLIRPDHIPLYTHPAPAAPQAEPCIGNDPMCPCQDGDACHYKDSADGTKAWPVPQSEPKRKDQSMRDLLAIIHCDGGHHTEAVGLDQSIKDAQAAVCELKRRLAMEERVPLSDKMVIACARVEITRIQPDEWVASDADLVNFARAIERVHGIGGSDAE